jgi:CheY-like chemotaxis protein
MDLQMPNMDGFEASEHIIKLMRDHNDEDYCHIVALTSYTSAEVRERVLKIGLKDLINKPLHAKDLEKMVYTHFYRLTVSQVIQKCENK